MLNLRSADRVILKCCHSRKSCHSWPTYLLFTVIQKGQTGVIEQYLPSVLENLLLNGHNLSCSLILKSNANKISICFS